MQQLFGALSAILVIVGFVPYIKYIIKNRHTADEGKPIKITWLIWASNDTVILIGMYLAGSLNGQISAAALCGWTTFILALFYGNKGWKVIDVVCAVGAVIGIALSLFYSNPTIAIIASNAVLLVGAIPTFISTIEAPERENRLAWTLWLASCPFALLATPVWDTDHLAQPITFLIIEVVEMTLLLTVPYFKTSKQIK